jgi:hypothetical protein
VCGASIAAALVIGCSSAQSGHAPGVAGGETLTPGVTNYPLAYIKQPVLPTKATETEPTDINVEDLITSITGSDLYVRARPAPAAPRSTSPRPSPAAKGAVRDLDVSPDGTKIVFSLRLPLNPKLKNTDPKQPTWKIYQYDADTASGHPAHQRQHHGRSRRGRPLPAGRPYRVRLDPPAGHPVHPAERRPAAVPGGDRQPATIHISAACHERRRHRHASNQLQHQPRLRTIGAGQRPDRVFALGSDQRPRTRSACTCNPDGTGLQLYYGANSHATGANIAGTNTNVIQFLNAGSARTASSSPSIGRFSALSWAAISCSSTPPISWNSIKQLAQRRRYRVTTARPPAKAAPPRSGVTTDANMPSLGGRFASAYPLYDGTNRMLVSWAPCLVTNTDGTTSICNSSNTTGANVVQAPPQYTIWIYDFDAGTLSPLLSADHGCRDRRAGHPAGAHARAHLYSGLQSRVPRPPRTW